MNELDLQSALHVLVHPNMGLAVRIAKRPGAELIDIALIVPEYLIHSLRVPVTGGVNHRKRKKLLALVSGFLHISKTLNEIDGMGQKTFTGKMAISKEDYSQLTALAKEGITSRAEIKSLEQNANYYRQKYFDSANALERMKTKYNELKEKCKPFLEALEHFPEVAKLFTEKVRQLFSFKEEQQRAEKEAREKERQERIKARRNKRDMER